MMCSYLDSCQYFIVIVCLSNKGTQTGCGFIWGISADPSSAACNCSRKTAL